MNLVWTGQFKRDYKRIKKQNKDVNELRAVLEHLMAHQPLAARHRDHRLSGDWKNHRECHIAPDWLLIYRIDGENLILERMGSHSELFKR